MIDIIITVFVTLFIGAGVLLTFVPFVPALFLMLLLALGFGFWDGFLRLSVQEFLVLGGVFVVSMIIDLFAGLIGAKYGGAGWRAMGMGVLASVVGFFILPPFGALLGFFLGIFGTELYRKRNERLALRAALGGLIGAVTGVLANFALALAFFGLFLFFILR